jgi:hypothetical protein
MRRILFHAAYQRYSIGFGLGFGLLFSIRLWGTEPAQDALQSLLAVAYWGVDPESGVIGILMPLIPPMVFCAVISSFLADDRLIVGVYLLPRATRAYKWYLPKVCALWLHTFEFTVIYLGCIIVAQRNVSWQTIMPVIYYAISLCAAGTAIAVLTLRFPTKWVIIGSVVFLAISIITAQPLQEHPALARFHPLYHFFPEWRKNVAGLSILFFVFFIALSSIVGWLMIRQKDIFLTGKDRDE